ncbi:MAG: hypothetical protein ACK4UQ_12110 [Brevundimonas sp.]
MKAAPSLLALAVLITACQPAAETPGVATPPVAPDATPAPATATATAQEASPDAALTAFLQTRTRDAMPPLGYVARAVGDGSDALTLVYLVGPEVCGSGGCNLMILRRSGDGYAVVGDTTVTRAPIRLLSTRTNGLPDIGVHVAGGGVTEGYEARLRFDGARYPSNPTVAPAERVTEAEGVVLITDDDARTPLKS